MPLFNALRDWRAERSKRDGVPPYLICTNKQLVAMIKTRPRSLGKLGEIEGIGKAKLEKYGQELLSMLSMPPGSGFRSASGSNASKGKRDMTGPAAPPAKPPLLEGA